MHGSSVLARCKPFHLIKRKKAACGLQIRSEISISTNTAGWNELPLDRCGNCVRTKQSLGVQDAL